MHKFAMGDNNDLCFTRAIASRPTLDLIPNMMDTLEELPNDPKSRESESVRE
jgi:hypothetical protein